MTHALFFFSSIAFWGVIFFVIISTYINIRRIREETKKANELLVGTDRKLPEKAVVDLGADENGE